MNENLKVLIVDDDADTRLLIRKSLQGLHYNTIEVSSGEDAIEIIENGIGDIDVMLLDILMSGMDGFSVLRHLKENPKASQTKTIMLTTIDQTEHKVRALSMGASDYIVKPFDKAELVARIGMQARLKKAETAVMESEEKFSKAFNSNAALMVIGTFEHDQFIEVNESFLKTMGFERTEVIGRTSSELEMFADSNQRDFLYQEVKQCGFARDIDVSIKTKNGEIRHVLFSA
ncbi:response regulator, partial [Chloroflexota bacterium]